jgi:potassium/chloride transporter 4/5/6
VISNTLANGTIVAGGTTISTPNLHDLQIYGVVITILLCFIVFGGVKIINKVAPAFLIPVLFSILCIFIGVFSAPGSGASSK